jgi:hypothetical protein
MQARIKFLADIVLVFLFGLFQGFSLIVFYGVKPNLLIPLLINLMFSVKNFWQYLILILTAMISLKYSEFVGREIIIFGVLMCLVFYFKKYLTDHILLSSFFLIFVLTVVFNLGIDYRFVFGNIKIILLELFYNLSAGAVLWLIYQHDYEKK